MSRALFLAMLFLASGCTHSNGVRPLHPLELATSLYSETVTSAQAGSVMHEGDCLLFRDDRTAAQFLPVWPYGSVFNGTSVIFHQPAKADQRIVIGEEFVMEGQSVSWRSLSSADYVPFRHQCRANPFFVSRVRPAN
jgi:hypothetical protein